MSDIGNQPNEELGQEVSQAKREAAELAEAARERGLREIEAAKSEVADRAERIAEAVEKTSDELESDGGAAISGYGRSLAALMRQLAGGLRERDVEELASELATFARHNQAIFLAGSVALGFGLTRFLKGGAHGPDDEITYDDDHYATFDPQYEDDFLDQHAPESLGMASQRVEETAGPTAPMRGDGA